MTDQPLVLNPNGSPGTGQLEMVEAYVDSAPAILSARQRRDRILVGLFVAVMLVTALYNFVIATPRYASQFSYVVRTAAPSQERFTIMNMAAAGETSDNGQAIIAYVNSRDMVERLNRDGLLSRIFSAAGVDIFARFPSWLEGNGREHFFRHVARFIDADYDERNNITYVEVQAFRPRDAQEIAQRIRKAAEEKINALNDRARAGMTAAAEREAESARVQLAGILAQLQSVRNRNRVLDAKLQSGAALKVAVASAGELASLNVQIAQTRASTPGSPALSQMIARREALRRELARQNAAMAGGANSLADRIRPGEELGSARDAAEKRLLGASLALATARSNADRTRLYLEWISRPDLPDEPLYPHRARNLAIVAALTLALLWIVRSLSELLFDADE